MDNLIYYLGSFSVFFVLLFLIARIVFLVAIYESSKNRGRNEIGWTILAFFTSPLMCLPFIYVLGETKEKWEERIINEEALRKQVRDGVYKVNSIVSNSPSNSPSKSDETNNAVSDKMTYGNLSVGDIVINKYTNDHLKITGITQDDRFICEREDGTFAGNYIITALDKI